MSASDNPRTTEDHKTFVSMCEGKTERQQAFLISLFQNPGADWTSIAPALLEIDFGKIITGLPDIVNRVVLPDHRDKALDTVHVVYSVVLPITDSLREFAVSKRDLFIILAVTARTIDIHDVCEKGSWTGVVCEELMPSLGTSLKQASKFPKILGHWSLRAGFDGSRLAGTESIVDRPPNGVEVDIFTGALTAVGNHVGWSAMNHLAMLLLNADVTVGAFERYRSQLQEQASRMQGNVPRAHQKTLNALALAELNKIGPVKAFDACRRHLSQH